VSYIQKRDGRYAARYRGPLGRVTSATFDRKADAQRFLAEMETDNLRGSWIDPRHAEVPLAHWSQEFLATKATQGLVITVAQATAITSKLARVNSLETPR
jgi:hypothetical protein